MAFFYINSMGSANVRKSNDYVSKMIELAGGKYIFNDLGTDEEGLSTMNMGMEDFYAGARDADYIIYNSTIDGELKSLDELLKKSDASEGFQGGQRRQCLVSDQEHVSGNHLSWRCDHGYPPDADGG